MILVRSRTNEDLLTPIDNASHDLEFRNNSKRGKDRSIGFLQVASLGEKLKQSFEQMATKAEETDNGEPMALLRVSRSNDDIHINRALHVSDNNKSLSDMRKINVPQVPKKPSNLLNQHFPSPLKTENLGAFNAAKFF
jgi:hypothetical protein